jgi:hypothetical protein
VKEILEEVERVNAAEDEVYGEDNPDEPGGKGKIDVEKLVKKIQELIERLKQKPEDKQLAKAVKTLTKDCLPRQKKYKEQARRLAGRTSYPKTYDV